MCIYIYVYFPLVSRLGCCFLVLCLYLEKTVAAVKDIWSELTNSERRGACALINAGQNGIFAGWQEAKDDLDNKKKLLNQAAGLDQQYPGGLAQYAKNVKALLEASKLGKNPFEGMVPTVPAGERLEFQTPEFHAAEAVGLREARNMAFMLVAGGLGERLGYHGIKVALPYQSVTKECYLQLYCQYILALQQRARVESKDDTIILPFAIMTSGDTHARTVDLLESNNNFGMTADQITIVKQEKVPAIVDNNGVFAIDSDDRYTIATKPHGHGDVHMLLHQSGLAAKWAKEGRKWLTFMQDTNAQVIHALAAAVGVSANNDFDINSLTVPRRPGEAVGGICRLENKTSGDSLTINVEYNQLDPLLRATVSPQGDVADEKSGFSPYPGNINVLIFKIPTYAAVLERTQGAIPEFVNPKYADDTKTKFKKPTRLECMMQDFPKLVGKDAKVGFTQCERFLSFSAVKNDVVSAAAKAKATGYPESAASGEADVYSFFRKTLSDIGVAVNPDGERVEFAGVPVNKGALVLCKPTVGVTLAELYRTFGCTEPGKPTSSDIKISDRSTVILNGSDITIESMDIDGCVEISAVPGAKVIVKKCIVRNDGSEFVAVDPTDESVAEELRIRGYDIVEKQCQRFVFDQPGEYTIEHE
jgi:UDP-sugar pyrophosphorylase